MDSSRVRSFLRFKSGHIGLEDRGMLHLNVLLQAWLIHVGSLGTFWTKVAFENASRFFLSMSKQVLFQVGPRSKWFQALVTGIRLITRMHSFMSNKIRNLRETFWATCKVADVRLSLIMNSLMFLERRVLHECLSTCVTEVRGIYHE